MKKLITVALLALLATGAHAQSYCSPEAVLNAYKEFQSTVDATALQRQVQLASTGGVQSAIDNHRMGWKAFDDHNMMMTVGRQQALCNAEMQRKK